MLRPLLLLLFISLPTQAQEVEKLNYRISYSGLITGFIWKELADMRINFQPEETSFRGQAAVQLSMEVSTEHYSFAELFQAMRYRWVSTLSPDLQRILLVRVVDEGDSDSHDVYWYDWSNNLISLFAKRKQFDTRIPFEEDDQPPRLEWEKDRLPPPPEFIDSFPGASPELSYLITKKQRPEKLEGSAIDPLTMLLQLSRHNFVPDETLTLQILNDEDLDNYQARLIGKENLQLNGCAKPAVQIEMQRSSAKGAEGNMKMWISDDERRLPLRIDLDAPLGMVHIELQTVQPIPLSRHCSEAQETLKEQEATTDWFASPPY